MTNDTRLIRILCVDDHPLLRSGIAALLATQPDMEMVGEASSGNEAVQMHRRLNPDVTLMDLQMPDMSGLELVEKMNELGLSLPTIFMTAHADPMLMVEISKRDSMDLLEKPFTGDALIDAVRKVTQGWIANGGDPRKCCR